MVLAGYSPFLNRSRPALPVPGPLSVVLVAPGQDDLGVAARPVGVGDATCVQAEALVGGRLQAGRASEGAKKDSYIQDNKRHGCTFCEVYTISLSN